MGCHLTGGLFLILALSWARAHPGHEGDLETAAGGLPESKVTITEEGTFRVIRANGIPNHETGKFPGPGCPNAISAQSYLFRVPRYPQTNATFTFLKQQAIGVALNGVPFDPGTAEYWKNDRTSGWHIEAIGGGKSLGLDRNLAHVQPNGAYHYHGIPTGLLATMSEQKEPKLIGYAADGFPIYAWSGAAQHIFGLADQPDTATMNKALADWMDSSAIETTAALPPWDKTEGQPGRAEFPFMPAEWLDKATYEAMRTEKLHTHCFPQGMESLNCLVLRDGQVEEIGLQLFPG